MGTDDKMKINKCWILGSFILIASTVMAQSSDRSLVPPRRQFAYERLEEDTRPKPDLTPVPSGKGEKGVRFKAKAGWQPNGIAVCDTAPSALPKIVSDGNSGAIICWTECYRDQVSLDDDIYAQRVDSGGNFVWASQGVPVCSLKGSYSNYPAMISDGKGGAIIAWEDSRGGLGYTRVFAQRLDSLGNRLWPENGVLVCNQMSGYVDMCSDGHGGAIVAWADGRNEATTSDDIYAQRIDSAGNMVWAIDGVPVCTADSIQFWPHMCATQNNGAVITWEDDYRNNSTTGRDVYAQMIDSLGNIKWTLNGEPICIKTGIQRISVGLSPIKNLYGGGIIGWWDFSITPAKMYSQSFDSISIKHWSDSGVAFEYGYKIISDDKGGGIICSDSVNRIDFLGNICWGAGVSVHDTISLSGGGDASEDQFGGVVSIWTHSTHLYAQRVDSSGVVLWETTGVSVCTTMNTNNYQKVIGDCLGGAIAAWYGSPINGDNHIWAQRVYADGSPGGVEGESIQDAEYRIKNIKAYPNPFSQSTIVNYQLPQPGWVSLKVYNISGQLVKVLTDEWQVTGLHKISWNGLADCNGRPSNGVYFIRYDCEGMSSITKIIKIK
jgi:hypothetical protein